MFTFGDTVHDDRGTSNSKFGVEATPRPSIAVLCLFAVLSTKQFWTTVLGSLHQHVHIILSSNSAKCPTDVKK